MMDATGHADGQPGGGQMRVGVPLTDISAGRINVVSDLENDPQLPARGMIVDRPRQDGSGVRLAGRYRRRARIPKRCYATGLGWRRRIAMARRREVI